MKPHADWIGWCLQFVLGLVVGAIVGMATVLRRFGPPLIDYHLIPFWLAGAALIGGGIASHYGDQLWLGSSMRVIPPDAPEQSNASSICSFAAGGLGAALIIFVLCRNLGLV